MADWEYKDLYVKLDLMIEHKFGPRDPSFMTPREDATYTRLVREALQDEAQEGWQPEGPTDWWSLMQQDRAFVHYEGGFLQSLVAKPPVWIFEGVSLRLRRPVA